LGRRRRVGDGAGGTRRAGEPPAGEGACAAAVAAAKSAANARRRPRALRQPVENTPDSASARTKTIARATEPG